MAWEQHSHADGETFTADDMNRMEEAIYDGGGYASKKDWGDGNVPGVDGWNRLEQGILDVGSDLITPNLMLNTNKPEISSSSSAVTDAWIIASGGNGTGVELDLTDDDTVPTDGGLRIQDNTSGNRDCDQRAEYCEGGKTYTLSWYVRIPDGTSTRMYVRIYGRSPAVDYLTAALQYIEHTDWQRYSYTWTQDSTYTALSFKFGVANAGTIDYCGMKCEEGDTATPYGPNPTELFTTKTWEATQDDDNKITGSEANRWEQGITDMLNYREKYGTFENATASPQSVEDGSDTEVAPGPVEIE